MVEIDGVCRNPRTFCIPKDQEKNQSVQCCNGLTEYNGFCRDLSSGIAYWINTRSLGLEVMYKDIIIKGKKRDEKRDKYIIKNQHKICPEGWRIPTKEEFEKIATVKEELGINSSNRYITLTAKKLYINQNGRFKSYKETKTEINDYYYEYRDYAFNYWHDLYVRCVRDYLPETQQ